MSGATYFSVFTQREFNLYERTRNSQLAHQKGQFINRFEYLETHLNQTISPFVKKRINFETLEKSEFMNEVFFHTVYLCSNYVVRANLRLPCHLCNWILGYTCIQV